MNYISQEQEDIVKCLSKHKMICGVAGSRKTDTLVKVVQHDLNLFKHNILLLTKISSVSNELKQRIENTMDVKFVSHGKHYIANIDGSFVCISNFDGWVHKMCENSDILVDGDWFSEKIKLLNHSLMNKNIKCIMKNNELVQKIIVDEVQDLDNDQVNIILNMCKNDDKLSIITAGDYIQTLFMKSDINGEHPMNLLRRLNPKEFFLTKNWRSPDAHIKWNNILFSDFHEKNYTKPMISTNFNEIDKPFLFTHGSLSNGVESLSVATDVAKIVNVIMENDKSIKPSDIIVMMRKCNNNTTFVHLKNQLNIVFNKRGYNKKDNVCVFQTKSVNGNITINWNKAKDKAVLCSIVADKGKGHKIVFVLGMSEDSLPMSHNLFKDSELIEHSTFNVALTRSEKMLFVGMNRVHASRYIIKSRSTLDNTCYMAWNNNTTLPEPYESIRDVFVKEFNSGKITYNGEPFWASIDNYRQNIQLTGDKSIIDVSNDIVSAFGHHKELFGTIDMENLSISKFGEEQIIEYSTEDDELAPIFGNMCGLLVERIINTKETCDIFKNQDNWIYTEDERILTVMHDVKKYPKDLLNNYFVIHKDWFDKNLDIKKCIIDAISKNHIYIHEIFNNDKFKQDILEFTDTSIPNESISTHILWNCTLLWIQIKSLYNPSFKNIYGAITQDISVLHSNINSYLKSKPTDLKSEMDLSLMSKIDDPDELMQIEPNKKLIAHVCGIRARCDFYSKINTKVIEMKASYKKTCINQWLIQVLYYFMLLKTKKMECNKIEVVNMLQGISYEMDIHDLPVHSYHTFKKTFNFFNWNQLEKDCFFATWQL